MYFTKCKSLLAFSVVVHAVVLSAAVATLSAGEPTANSSGKKSIAKSDENLNQWGSVTARLVTHRDVAGNNGAPNQFSKPSFGVPDAVLCVRRVTRVHEAFGENSRNPAVMNYQNNLISPHVIAVRVGEELKIENSGSKTEVIVVHAPFGQDNSLLLEPNGTTKWRFTHSESIPVCISCWHGRRTASNSQGYAVVVTNPYVGVSDCEGCVSIANLPAGEDLELRIWHERTGWVNKQLHAVVPANDSVDLGEIRLTTDTASAEHVHF